MISESCHSHIIKPSWSVSENIAAMSTTRKGGVSEAPWNTLNLATHVNDRLDNVLQNRCLLKQACALPHEPSWLEQIHSSEIIRLTSSNFQQTFQADASYTTESNIICTVMTADCLPILLCNKQATWVAAVHAGWKGVANGILKKILALYVNNIGGDKKDLCVWIGPAIGAKAYQVGEDVRAAFIQQDAILHNAFTDDGAGRYLLNNAYAARLQLMSGGLTTEQIIAPEFCTFQDSKRFFSYRRDGTRSGRMASMIWIKNVPL